MTFKPVSSIIRDKLTSRNLKSRIFPEDIGPHGMLFVFKEYNFTAIRNGQRGTSEGSVDSNITSTILLPLPANIRDSYSVKLNTNELGTIGNAIAKTAASSRTAASSGAYEDLKNETLGMFPTEIPDSDVSQMDGAFVPNIQFLARKSMDQFGISTPIDIGLGSTINPKVALSFDGVNMKNHSFTWQLAPRSQQESETLKEIINLIKYNILPGYQDVAFGSTVGQRALLNYPSMVDIWFLGIQENYYFKFKTCMVSDFEVNYTPQGLSVLRGGKPSTVNMNISLSETDIWTKDDFSGES